MSRRFGHPTQWALAAWFVLAGWVVGWPLGSSRIGWATTLIALLPLLVPLAGIARGRRRAFALAPLALAPALALAVTETLVNPAARLRAGATLALILVAFAAVLAALRAAPRA